MAVIQDKKNTGKSFSLKRIVINAVVLFAFLIGLSYAAVVITNDDIKKDGVSAMFQGSTWTDPQNASGNDLSEVDDFTVNQVTVASGLNESQLTINKLATGSGTLITAHNDGTGTNTFINQDGDGISLYIDSEATTTTSYGLQIDAGYGARGLFVQEDANNWAKFGNPEDDSISSNKIYRNYNSTYTANPVFEVIQDHSSDDQTAFRLQQDGSGMGMEISGTGNMSQTYLGLLRILQDSETSLKPALTVRQDGDGDALAIYDGDNTKVRFRVSGNLTSVEGIDNEAEERGFLVKDENSNKYFEVNSTGSGDADTGEVNVYGKFQMMSGTTIYQLSISGTQLTLSRVS